MAIKKKVDCNKCVNYNTIWCSECKHYKWLMDFYMEKENEDRQEI